MKLSFATIIIMAVSIAVGILSFAFFHQWIPTMTVAHNYDTYREQLTTEANKESQVKRRVEKAIQAVQVKTDAWNGYVAVKTPPTNVSDGGISLTVNPYQLTVDTQKFRNSIQKAVNAQVKKGGVKVEVGPLVRGPQSTDDAGALLADFYNYPGIKFPVVLFDLGQVTVTGTYEQIMANVRAYKSMPRYLAVTDGLAITGTSPNLTGTYNLSIVGFIRGKEIFPTVPAGVATAGGALGGFGGPGGPGGFGGMRGGGMPPSGAFPGGPPSGFNPPGRGGAK